MRGKMSLARPSCHGWPNWQGKRGHSAWLKAHVNLTLAKMVVLEECRWPPLWLKWQAWLPTIVHVRGTCGCPWPCPRACPWQPTARVRGTCGCPWPCPWQPSVLVRGTCGCPWTCPWQPTVRVRGTCGRPSSCMSLAAHRACPWHKWQPMAVPTCMSVAHVAAHGRALVSVFGTAHGRANVHVRGKPLCMPVAQVAAHRRALARVLGSPTFNSVAQVAAHGRPSQCPYLVHARATSGCPSCMSVAQMALGNAQGTHPALMQCLRRATYPSSVPPQALGVRGTNTRGTNTRHFVRLASSSVGRPGRYKIAQV